MSTEDTNNLLDYINQQNKVIKQLQEELAETRHHSAQLQNKLNIIEDYKCS